MKLMISRILKKNFRGEGEQELCKDGNKTNLK